MESVLLLSPITALEFVGEHLLAGEGPILSVYSLKSETESYRNCLKNVLGNCHIHGIKQCCLQNSETFGQLLAVFGGKCLIVLQFNESNGGAVLQEVSRLWELHDWIWDVQWLAVSNEKALYLGLALGHNSVVLYDYTVGKPLKEVHCEEKCILYSAHFFGQTWHELVLISGTVFNQLVVWRMSGSANTDGRIKTEKRISGHNGVIFSVFYLQNKGILASASDDRSIRLWNVGDLKQDPSFSPDLVQCLLMLYGHQSRVWSVKLLNDYIISIGEDSACIVWNYSGEILHHFKGHVGRSIRAVAVNEDQGWVVTGGADSGIRLWKIGKHILEEDGPVCLNLCGVTITGLPKAVTLVGQSQLLVMTDAGCVYSYCLISKQWNFILEDSSYQSYSLLEVVELLNGLVLCAIGNITGHIKIFLLSCPGEYIEKKIYNGKVHSLSWAFHKEYNADRCNLFCSGPEGIMVWLEVLCCNNCIVSVEGKHHYLLPMCKQRWHTGIAFLHQEDLFVCGDRRGSLLLYSCTAAKVTDGGSKLYKAALFPKNSSVELENYVRLDVKNPVLEKVTLQGQEPVSILYGLHGKVGATSVCFHEGFIYSTGRDGCICQLKVEGGQLKVLRSQRVCKGMDWIEQLFFTPENDLLVLGFHSISFVLWSTRTNEKLWSVHCGGGHRSWSYIRTNFQNIFAYIKSGDIFVCQRQLSDYSQPLIKECLHGRELACVRHLTGFKKTNCEHVKILVTGSEDTTMNIFAFSESLGYIEKLATINDHISSIKAMAVSVVEKTNTCTSAVLFSGGGRAQLECYQLLLNYSPTTCDVKSQVIHLASHRLDEQWDHMRNRHKLIKMDPETRYMSVAVLNDETKPEGSHECLLVAACSDGFIRMFKLQENNKKLLLLAESCFHQRCVLRVEVFSYQPACGQRRTFMCSAATDGKIAFWDITELINRVQSAHNFVDLEHGILDLGCPESVLQIHQSGVSSLHIRDTEKDGEYLLATGGDDNAVHLCFLTVDLASDAVEPSAVTKHHPNNSEVAVEHCVSHCSVQVIKKLSAFFAHAAHVTGVRILDVGLLASTSIDQRLTLWKIEEDGLQFLCSKFCHVADVADLECWKEENSKTHFFALCGQGLQIIKSQESGLTQV
ncbi:WD repeat-containing protein 6 [Protopterus annectens]|uniref:WD repeat-containing protein 6 n=1 Tax=Protopterus annectens TaxID=7888 RepID=UPI001CF95254|nr:WD repeat-containing protein 6 [Protopterus annectens]XP_043934685.1 WD repeat-containing protein 6 [Protopterus annectens]